MRRLVPLVALVGLLVAAPPAAAGGFATVGLSSTPDGLGANRPWHVDITVLMHGRNPAPMVQPSVEISSGSDTRVFATRETAKEGVYRATVTFPRAGTWDYRVNDGYSGMEHSFPPARIVAGAGDGQAAQAERSIDAAPPSDGGLAWGWLAGAAAALAAAALVLVADRRRVIPPGAPEPA